jgi:hypothetical protein
MSRARDIADGKFSGAVVAASADFTGTVEAADLSDGTTTVGTEYVTNGSAKAWVNFDGTGTIAARDSLNLSSLTDSGTGSYVVNFSNAFGAADYSGNCNLGYVLTTPEAVCFFLASDYLAASARVLCGFTYTSPGATDASVVLAQAFGDLA